MHIHAERDAFVEGLLREMRVVAVADPRAVAELGTQIHSTVLFHVHLKQLMNVYSVDWILPMILPSAWTY